MSGSIRQFPEIFDVQSERLQESELVSKCQAGDTQAFSQLVTMYQERVLYLVHSIVSNEHDAWDLSQEIFLRCWQKIHDFQGRSSLYTWLRSLGTNAALQSLRRRKRHLEVELTERLPCYGFGPDRSCQHHEIGQLIQAALGKLSPNHRAVIILKELEGMSYHEIAAGLNLSIGTVMSRLFYARRRLQAILRPLL
jgi:RNA polymerase sigma-70 factor, ECF subfamily